MGGARMTTIQRLKVWTIGLPVSVRAAAFVAGFIFAVPTVVLCAVAWVKLLMDFFFPGWRN
jgi:hypothetical protein